MRFTTCVLIAALSASACNDAVTDRSELAAEGTGRGASAERAQLWVGSATSKPEPGDQAIRLDPAASTTSSATLDSPPLSLTMPEGVRGKWRRATGSSVTTAQCVDSANDNMGKILTIRADGFSRFEDGGRLIRVQERDTSRIRATFDTTYADTPTQGEFAFEAQDNDRTLIERQYGDGAQPGLLRYRRCPAS